MTSEVCPFCGKTFKRLKSHLPYCKASASSMTQNDAAGKETPSPQLATAASQTTPNGKKTPPLSAHLQTKKSKKMSVISSKPTQLPSPATAPVSVNTASSSLSRTSTSLPPPAKKNKQKLVDQIKMANMLPSDTVSLISSSPPVLSEPKHKKEAKPSSKGSPEGATSASEDLLSHLNTRTTAWTKINSDKDSVSDVTKPRDALKKKSSKTKKAAESSAPDSRDVHINETSTKPQAGDFEGGIGNLSVSKTFLKSRSGHQAGITLQDVKATLRRARANNQSSRTSILGLVETVDELNSLSPVIVPADRQKDKPLSDMLPSTRSQYAELLSDKEKSLNSDQGSSDPVPVPHPKPNPPATPLLPGCLASPVSPAALCSHTVSAKDGSKVGHRTTGLLSLSPVQFSRPQAFLLPPPVRGGTLRAEEGSSAEKSQLDLVKQNAARGGTEGALTQLPLGQVKLRELPDWLSCKTPRNLRDAVEMVQRGWQWYHRRYIGVKKGGVGGLGMMLAGYCVLSYIWTYPRLKHDRWRKYH